MRDRNIAFMSDQIEGNEAELASVDDLQIAAAAAAAAIDAMNTYNEDDSEEDDYRESEDDDDTAMSTSDSDKYDDEEEEEGSDGPVQMLLRVADENSGRVQVQFVILPQQQKQMHEYNTDHGDDGEFHVMYDEDNDMEEEEEDDEDDDGIEELHDYEDLRRIVDSMESYDPAEIQDHGPLASEVLFGDAPLPRNLSDVEIAPDEAITKAGKILSVIEGTIVVRAAGGSRALDEGSVLVLEDRTVLGVVEDIFGPVQAPLYALRYSAKDDSQKDLAVKIKVASEVTVFSVDRLAEFVVEEHLRVKGYDEGEDEDGTFPSAENTTGGRVPPADPDLQFSDDEAEAQYKRKLKAKRKGITTTDGGVSNGNSRTFSGRLPRRGRGFGGGGGVHGGGRGPTGSQFHNNNQRNAQHHANRGRMPPPPPMMMMNSNRSYYGGQQPYVPPQVSPNNTRPPPPPSPPQFLGQYYQQFGGGPAPAQTFQAHATAGQLGAMSLQPHHVYSSRAVGGQGVQYLRQPPPPPPQAPSAGPTSPMMPSLGGGSNLGQQ